MLCCCVGGGQGTVRLMGGVLCCVVLMRRREARYIKYDFCAHSLCDVFDAEVLMLRLIEYKL
jgi:hypothetical protein